MENAVANLASMTDGTGRRRRDFERLLTFVDAIVAIAITLLVLPLAELTADVGDQPVTHVLRAHQGQLWSFLLSFAVIARLWFVQHHSLRNVLIAPSRLGVLLMSWSATIVFLPFPHRPAGRLRIAGPDQAPV